MVLLLYVCIYASVSQTSVRTCEWQGVYLIQLCLQFPSEGPGSECAQGSLIEGFIHKLSQAVVGEIGTSNFITLLSYQSY